MKIPKKLSKRPFASLISFDRSMKDKTHQYIFTKIKLWLFKFDNTNCHDHSLDRLDNK